MKTTLHLVVAALLLIVAPAFAQVTHKFPATDTNNVWTGKNSVSGIGQIIATDAPYDFSFNLENPTPGDTGKWQHRIRRATNAVEMTCDVDTGTASVNIEIRTAPNVAGTTLLSSPLSCTTNETKTTTFSVAAIPAGAYLALDIVSANAGIVRAHLSVQPQ